MTINTMGQVKESLHKINGVNYVSPNSESEFDNMHTLSRINANWVSLTPFTFLNYNDPNFAFDSTRNWMGDSMEGITKLIEEARSNDLKIMLKPHFIMEDMKWVGDFTLNSDDWVVWEKNYMEYILDLAVMAEKYELEMLCIGTEFKYSVNNRTKFWKALIKKVRIVYSGQLTYASNWDNYYNISFWNELDYIGVDAYFPLSPKVNPSQESLEKSWQAINKRLSKLAVEKDKQIIFTEYGYRSIDGACWEQWTIESVPSNEKVNLEAQLIGYQALYNAVWDEEWIAGGFIWRWLANDKVFEGATHSNYSPQNKPAEATIKKYYSRE